MYKPDIPPGIDDAIQRHPSQLEQVDFLPICAGNGMLRVGQADEGNPLILPVLTENRCGIGSHSQDFCAAARELFVLIAQARQLRAAVGSHESAQERQDHWPAAKIR